MSTLDTNNYETYVSYTGDAEEIKKFKEETIDRGFFSFPSILPVPKELVDNPMIQNACYNALMLHALKHDYRIKYYGNIRDKYSKDEFYKNILLPYTRTGIQYKPYTEKELIQIAFRDEMGGDKDMHTVEEALSVLRGKSDESECEKAIKRMYKYGYATRYAWRLANWGAPMEATGCQVRPEEAKVAPYTSDALMIYTSGGNGLKLLHFMAKKYPKISFEFIWRRIMEEKEKPEDTNQYGGQETWDNGELINSIDYAYKLRGTGMGTTEEMDELMNTLKKTFREGWKKEE